MTNTNNPHPAPTSLPPPPPGLKALAWSHAAGADVFEISARSRTARQANPGTGRHLDKPYRQLYRHVADTAGPRYGFCEKKAH